MLAGLKEAMPEELDASREVRIKFWWHSPSGPTNPAQKLPALEWEGLVGN